MKPSPSAARLISLRRTVFCEANSAPGFQGLERASGLDVPATILEWIVATQDAPAPAPAAAESSVLADMIFGGRTGLRAITDRNTHFREFASAMGVRLFGASMNCLGQALAPALLVDARSRTGLGLRALFEGRSRTDLSALDDSEQERTLIVVLALAIWAAILPWIADAGAMASGFLSLMALCFPLLYALTAPTGRVGRSVSALAKSDRG
jgi:gamma-F420-2:alpha-L-glutamate ligase